MNARSIQPAREGRTKKPPTRGPSSSRGVGWLPAAPSTSSTAKLSLQARGHPLPPAGSSPRAEDTAGPPRFCGPSKRGLHLGAACPTLLDPLPHHSAGNIPHVRATRCYLLANWPPWDSRTRGQASHITQGSPQPMRGKLKVWSPDRQHQHHLAVCEKQSLSWPGIQTGT